MPDMWHGSIKVCLLMNDNRFARIEIQNVSLPEAIKKHGVSPCAYPGMIPVFLIPGLETPFKHLGLNHDNGGRT